MTRKLVPKGRGDIFEWTQKKLPPYLTREEVRQVLKGMEQNRFYHLLINFLWQTGARITEALSVKVSDIDFYSKVVRMPSLKKRDPQIKTIPLKGDLLGELGAYIGQEGLRKESVLFPITRQHAHRVIKEACLKSRHRAKKVSSSRIPSFIRGKRRAAARAVADPSEMARPLGY